MYQDHKYVDECEMGLVGILTSQEEEAKSTAYIKMLLAKEQQYMQKYDGYDYDLEDSQDVLSEDDDYIPVGAKKKSQSKTSKTRVPSHSSSSMKRNSAKDSNAVVVPEISSSGDSSLLSDDKMQSVFKRGPWTDEEESRFLTALELHGREWNHVRKTYSI
jgi:hypothetical protein